MTRARDLLYRFRPAGAPGPASATGVPTDTVADVVAELEPLFAELAATERECADMIARAGLEAAQVRARATAQARSLVAAANERVDGERSAAMGQVRLGGEAESAAMVAAAEREAAQVRRRSDERMQPFVDSVVTLVLELVGKSVGKSVGESVSESTGSSQGIGERSAGPS